MVVLFFAAVLAGALNAVAGGGSFLTFPALIVTGVPPITANATSTVALWPGSAASAGAYRGELAVQDRRFLGVLAAVSLIGGVAGAVLLLHTPATTFTRLIPFLLLAATVLFAASPTIMARLRQRQASAKRSPRALWAVGAAQLAIAVYGGYFGGGIGILMLATLGLMGLENIHEMNALKTVLAACINGVAVVTFVLAHAVSWPQAIVMVVGAIVGGYVAAAYVRRVDPRWVRRFVILVGVVMTVYFFVR